MAEAYFGEGRHHHRHSVVHQLSGRRHKQAGRGEGFWDTLSDVGKKVVSVGKHALPYVMPGGNVAKAGLEYLGFGDGRRHLHARLAHHELGFQGYADGDAYASHSGGARRRHHKRGGDGDGEGDAMPRRRHHRVRGGEYAEPMYDELDYFGEGDGDGMRRRRHHRRGGSHAGGEGMPYHLGGEGDGMRHRRRRAGADGDAKHKRKPSARNMIVKKVMAEHGLSLPQASKYVKEHGLY